MLESCREDYFSVSNSIIKEDIYLQLYIIIKDNFSISSLSEYNLLLNEFYNSCTNLFNLYNDNSDEYKFGILSYSMEVEIIIDKKIKKFLLSLTNELNYYEFNELKDKILIDLISVTKSKLEIDDDKIISDIQKDWLYRIDAININFEKDYEDYQNKINSSIYVCFDSILKLPIINMFIQGDTNSPKKLIKI